MGYSASFNPSGGAAIAGLGMTEMTREYTYSATGLAGIAVRQAIADAGLDQYVQVEHDGNLNTSEVEVSFIGSGQDPEGSDLAYSWLQVSGDQVEIEDSHSSLITFEASNSFCLGVSTP